MSKPYDATSKDLIETDPAGWVSFLGCPVEAADVQLVDADVSTVTAEADKVIRVERPYPWLLHLEIQARWEEAFARRLLRYNALLQHRHGLPVASVAVLLRSSANMTELNGAFEVRSPIGRPWSFNYDVLRVWERPAADFLNGPLGLLPLAPLAHIRKPDLGEVVESLRTRIDGQEDRPLAAKLLTASYVLMGLRYDQSQIDSLFSEVLQMEESVTYQAIMRRGLQQGLQQGAMAEVRKAILIAGNKLLGPPNPGHHPLPNGPVPQLRAGALRSLSGSGQPQHSMVWR